MLRDREIPMSVLALNQPLLGLKSKTDSAVTNAKRIKDRVERNKARLVAFLSIRTIPNLFLLGRCLDRFIDILNSPAMDHFSDSDIKSVAHDLSLNGARLNKLIKSYENLGVRHMPIYGVLLDRLQSSNNHLSSIVEGLRLSFTEDFGQMIMEAADELRSAKNGAGRRSLVGHV